MPSAYNLTRREVHYRHAAFSEGLAAAGYAVHRETPAKAQPGDVLLIWNRYGQYHDIATRFEQQGGTVIVAENGYLGKDENGQQRYALARHAHNGRGQWEVGTTDRFSALGIPLQPWRKEGGHVLVCPNRHFGMPGMIMPLNWATDTAAKLGKITAREIRIRPHPGNVPPKKPLAEDLVDAWAVVIWGSSAGVHALVAGIPVICDSPWWICKGASSTLDKGDTLTYAYRERELQRLAWAQWTLAEIQSGAAFDHLLHPAR